MKRVLKREFRANYWAKIVLCLLFGLGLAACGLGSSDSAGTEIEFSNGTFAETMVEAQITSLFAEIYESVEPTLVVDEGTTRTLFAPNNAAVEKYLTEAADTIAGLIAKPEVAKALVLAHMVDGEVSATSLLNLGAKQLTMLNGANLSVAREASSTLLITDSGRRSVLIAIDIASKDGVVHIIDNVLN